MNSKVLIIPAAGSGSRLKKEIPKPYLEIAGKTILEHTITCFLSLDGLRQVAVATSESYLNITREILEKILPSNIMGICVVGGRERQHSIYNALQEVSEADLVIVHDAVRPFVTPAQIEACCSTAIDAGGAVLGVPAKDTIKRIDRELLIEETPSRRYLWQAQTPQVFKTKILMEAYSKAFEDDYIGTDDSSLVERLNYNVRMVEGSRSNFKITYPLDLKLARLLIEQKGD